MPTYRFKDNQQVNMGRVDDNLWDGRTYQKWYIELLPPTQMNIVSSVGSIDSKTDSGFKEVLSKAAEAHPNSPLAERYGRKSVKQTQVDRVRKKHMNRKLKGGGR